MDEQLLHELQKALMAWVEDPTQPAIDLAGFHLEHQAGEGDIHRVEVTRPTGEVERWEFGLAEPGESV